MEHLSGVDDFWLRMEKPENPLTITAMLHFKRRLTPQALKAKFGDDLLRFRRFRQLVAGHKQLFVQPRWEDDPGFSLGRHVFHRELPEGDEAGLRRLLGQLMSEPLDDDRPLWDAHLVDGVRPGTTLIVRVHHSLADGFSLIRLMFALIDEGCEVRLPGGAEIPSLGPGGHRIDASPGMLEEARQFAERLVESGLRTLRHPVPDTGPLKEVAQCAAQLFTMEPDAHNALKGPLSRRKGAAWSDHIPLDQIKACAHAYGGTVNDMLLGALAGALRRYMQEVGEEVEGLDMRAIVPVNVRPFETRTEELGNGFGLVFLDLPVGVETARARLEALKARMDALKRSPQAFVTFGLMQAVGLLPALIQEQLSGLFHGKSTAVVTNMPGPLDRITMAGEVIDDAVFFVPQSAGTGLGVSIFSYAGSVRVGVAADLGLIPDPAMLVAAYHAELADLGVSAQG